MEQDVGLEAGDQLQLVEASVAADVVEKRFLKGNHRLLRRRSHAVGQRDLTQCVHHAGAIHLFGAARGAGLARYALPDGLRAQGSVRLPELHQP